MLLPAAHVVPRGVLPEGVLELALARVERLEACGVSAASELSKYSCTDRPSFVKFIDTTAPPTPQEVLNHEALVDVRALTSWGDRSWIRRRELSQRSQENRLRSVNSPMLPWRPYALSQSLGWAISLKAGAGAEVPMRTTWISTPTDRVSSSVRSLSQSIAARCSGRKLVTTHTMVAGSVPAA